MRIKIAENATETCPKIECLINFNPLPSHPSPPPLDYDKKHRTKRSERKNNRNWENGFYCYCQSVFVYSFARCILTKCRIKCQRVYRRVYIVNKPKCISELSISFFFVFFRNISVWFFKHFKWLHLNSLLCLPLSSTRSFFPFLFFLPLAHSFGSLCVCVWVCVCGT